MSPRAPGGAATRRGRCDDGRRRTEPRRCGGLKRLRRGLLTSPPLRIPPGPGNTHVHAGIGHLSESEEAARECALTTARADAAEDTTAQELFRRKIPKGWPLKRDQHGPNPGVQRAFELAIVRIARADTRWWRIELTTDRNHREDSAWVCCFERSRQFRAGTKARGRGPVEVSGTVDHQGLAALRKDLLLNNCEGGGFAVALVCWTGVAPEDANSRIGRQLRIDVANGGEEVRVNWRVPDSVGSGFPD